MHPRPFFQTTQTTKRQLRQHKFMHPPPISHATEKEDNKYNKYYAIQRGGDLKTRKTKFIGYQTNIKNCPCCLSLLYRAECI